MQLLSLGQLLGAVTVQPVSSQLQELIQRPEMHRLVVIGIILLIVSQAVRIFSWWGSSLVLGRKETATVGNAVNVWVAMLVFIVVGILVIGFIASYAAQVREPWRIASTWGGVALLSTVIFFLIPMKIYAIGFWRALGIMVLASGMEGIVMAVLLFATGAVFLSTQDRVALQRLEQIQKDQIDRWEMEADRMAGKNPSAEITRLLDEATTIPRPSLWKREATVRTLQRRLDRQRRSLPPGNSEAAATFRRQLDRYMRLLQEVKAERAGSTANQAAYFPAENCTSLVT